MGVVWRVGVALGRGPLTAGVQGMEVHYMPFGEQVLLEEQYGPGHRWPGWTRRMGGGVQRGEWHPTSLLRPPRFWFRLYWFPLKVLYATSHCSLRAVPDIPFYFFFNALLLLLTLMNLYWFLVRGPGLRAL